MTEPRSAERRRLEDCEMRRADWKRWGTYVSERAWATVREDYSANGDAWDYFPHEQARSRAYRWNEDGIGGWCNRYQNICLSVALWNERDPILKERFFGVGGPQGNHGEDVKEYYYYLDGLPSHAYMLMLYKYPQVEYPYERLVAESEARTREVPEFELIDALGDDFAAGRYFDVFIEYARAAEEDVLCRITAINRGSEPAPLHVLPHLWYRNTWTWNAVKRRPRLHALDQRTVHTEHRHLGHRYWYVEADGQTPSLLFTENETNIERLFGAANESPYVKDGINEAVVGVRGDCVNPDGQGSKVAAHFHAVIQPGESFEVRVRFSQQPVDTPFDGFSGVFAQRIAEADEFYAEIQPPNMPADERLIARQAAAGLLWSKQFYHYNVDDWLEGDPGQPKPPSSRIHGRNHSWTTFDAFDVLSVPDKWEFPWFAAWDLSFHMVSMAALDPEWTKRQLTLLLREWYMHPNGQLPAYEWDFSDVNPPVHAWSSLQVYRITRQVTGHADTLFLERAFHKLLLNFTWWVNRKDSEGHNVFQGGFLGLDNIGVFDRSTDLPTGGRMEQADGTAWMAAYCLDMLMIALELAKTLPAYEDVATKFFEHFIYIADAFYDIGGSAALWDEQDGFFYDVLHTPDDQYHVMRVRSFVGLIPLLAVETLDTALINRLPHFRKRMDWFVENRPDLLANVIAPDEVGVNGRHHLAILDRNRLTRVLARVFDPAEFLSDYGLRSVSRYHADHPYEFVADGRVYSVEYEPGESRTGVFGGNSNWRGPIWFPVNFLVVEALRKYHLYYGDSFTVEVPTGSGNFMALDAAADELTRRLASIFVEKDGRRAVLGDNPLFQTDPNWRDYVPFHEYFHGDTGKGLGASHQTGWTSLVAPLLFDLRRDAERKPHTSA